MENNTAVIGTPEQAKWNEIKLSAEKNLIAMAAQTEIDMKILEMAKEKLLNLEEIDLGTEVQE